MTDQTLREKIVREFLTAIEKAKREHYSFAGKEKIANDHTDAILALPEMAEIETCELCDKPSETWFCIKCFNRQGEAK